MNNHSVNRIGESKFPYKIIGMNSTRLSFTENESKSGTPPRSKRKRKQNKYKKLTEMYSTQKYDQNGSILKKSENKDIKYHSDYFQSSFSNDSNKSNRSPKKWVSEMKGKKNKVRLQNNLLAASAICNDYLSKKLNSVNGLSKIDSGQNSFSDKDETDVFFFDLSGNKLSCSPDFKMETHNNGSVLSISPQDVVSLRKNKQKREKNNINKHFNDMSVIDNQDSDCEMTANSNFSLSKKPNEMTQMQNKGSDTKSFTKNEIMGESSNQRNVKKSHFEIKAKNSIYKGRNLKKAFDFEKSFETLLEYHKARSTPIQTEDRDHSLSNSKVMPKMMNPDDLYGDKICEKKKRKGVVDETKKKRERRRSNSGDRIYWYTSSSEENKDSEKESDLNLNFKRKKRKSIHHNHQSEPDISNIGVCATEHDSSEGQLMNNQSKKRKKKKISVEHTSLHISFENQELNNDTGNNLESKHHKSKSFDSTKFNNELRVKSDVFELDSSYSYKEIPGNDMSSNNIKTSGGEESFLQRPNGEKKLYSLKSNEFKKKKHKRKDFESNCTDDAELKYKLTNDSVDEGSENIDEQRIESPDIRKKYCKSEFVGDPVSKNNLEIHSSESELNFSHSFSKKKRRHEEINSVNKVSFNPQEPDVQKLELPDSTMTYTEKERVMESTDHEEFQNECKIEFRESELDLSNSFTEKSKCRDKSVQDMSSIENDKTSISVLEENSQIKSKKKKKHKADSSLDELFIVAEEKTTTKRKNVTEKLIEYEDFQAQNNACENETSLNHSFEKRKRMKKLGNIQQCIDKMSKWIIPDHIYEPSCEIHEINSTSPILESDMERIQISGEGHWLNKNELNTSLVHNTEEPINTDHKPDWNMGSPNTKEELDISYNDLKKFHNSKSSESDSSENIRCMNIRKINKNIRSQLDSKHAEAEVLKNLNIAIPFTIPPLHTNLERPSKPSLNEIEASKKFNVKLGAYSQEEDQIIKNNWERFCKEHDLNVEPSLFFKFPQKMKLDEKLKFLQYISHGLDNRLPQRVHFRFKTLFGNMVKKTGRFTEEEDKQILEFMEMEASKTPFSDLERILNRPSNAIERHYKRLHQQKLVWTPSKASQLVNCMLKVGKLESPEQLKDVKFSTKQWKKISKKMEDVPVIKLQRAWNITIYPRLFASGTLASTKKLIIDILDERQETDWRLIDWKEISKKFPGFSSEKLYMMFKKLVIFNVPNHLQKDIRKCIECLKDKRISTPHKFRKYEYKNGQLEYEDASEDDANFTI